VSVRVKRLRSRPILRRPRWARTTVAALVTVAVSVSATTLAGAAPAAPAPGGWQTIPGVRADFGQGIAAVGWASGRAWVALTGAGGNTMSVTSATVAGRRLRGFETTRLNASLYVRIIAGSELVYSVSQTNSDSLAARQLLPTGRLGPPTVPLDPKPIAPNQDLSAQAVLRVGGRTVWALPGDSRTGSVLWVCCAADGSGQNLTRFISRSSPPRPVHLGLDGRGRLWLSWHDASGVKIVELDPATLVPRTATPIRAPGRVVERFHMACAATCRLVIEAFRVGILSWAPGERSPTTIARAVNVGEKRAPWLLAAAYRSGKLAAAYIPYDAPFGVRVVRGDARGARPRLVGRLRKSLEGVSTHAAFGPVGLVAVTPVNAYDLSAVRIGLIRLP
jgi:hypothetical protein